jgi:hypothetical protein
MLKFCECGVGLWSLKTWKAGDNFILYTVISFSAFTLNSHPRVYTADGWYVIRAGNKI